MFVNSDLLTTPHFYSSTGLCFGSGFSSRVAYLDRVAHTLSKQLLWSKPSVIICVLSCTTQHTLGF